MGDGVGQVEASVRGRVQGVGFRYFAQGHAKRLGLRGWVRNERDGSVKVVAEGPRQDLEKLVEALRSGPPTSAVSAVDVEWNAPEGAYSDFVVRY